MAKAWFGGGRGANNPAGASAVRYIRMAGSCNVETTAAAAYLRWVAGAGKLRRLGCLMASNGRSTTTTFALYINGAAVNQTFTIGAGATGWFQDSVNSDAIANGDDFCLRQTNGTGTGTTNIWVVMAEFEADDGTTQVVLYWENSTTTLTTTGSVFPGVQGYAPGTGAEARQAVPAGAPGTLSKLRGVARTNTYSASSALLYARKNSADGTLNVAWGAGVTTAQEDNANADTFAIGDTCNWNLRGSAGGGTGNFVIDGILAAFKAEGSATEVGGNYGATTTSISTAGDTYYPIAGSRDQSSATEAAVAITTPFDMYISRLRAGYNGVATTSAFGPTLMVNGVATALSASFPTGTANATAADNTNVVFVPAGSTVSIRMSAGSAGTRNLSYLYAVIDTSPPPAVLNGPLSFNPGGPRPRRPQMPGFAAPHSAFFTLYAPPVALAAKPRRRRRHPQPLDFDVPVVGSFFTLYAPPVALAAKPRRRRRHPLAFGPLPGLVADATLYVPPFVPEPRPRRVRRRPRSLEQTGPGLGPQRRRRPFVYVQT
jgi:hypothetical protein